MIRCKGNKKKYFRNFFAVIVCSLLLTVTGAGSIAGSALEAGLSFTAGTEEQGQESWLRQLAGSLGPVEVEAAAVKKGWAKDSKGHRLYYRNGKKVKNRWLKVSGKWYLFNKKGYALKGWQKDSGKWYYLSTSTYAMKKGWVKLKGKWYYLDKSGVMQTGWITLNGKKYYLDKSGAMLTGSQTIDGKTYSFAEDGALIAGVEDASADSSQAEGSAEVNPEAQAQPAVKKKVVVIDPGHSSKIPSGSVPLGPGSKSMKAADAIGTRGVATGIYEYELALTVSLQLKTELEKRGYAVYLTRTDSLSAHSCVERAQTANEKNADVFIRIHANGCSDRSVTGAMTICITKNNPYIKGMYTKSKLLSSCVLDSYCKVTGARKEKVWETDTMTGNNWSKVPTTLIELGYMTNAAEDKLMSTKAYQAKMVRGMADGIDEYFRKL